MTSDCENETGAIWRLHGNIYKAHCKDPSLARKIVGWDGCESGAIHHYPDGHREIDVIFPARLYNRVAELLKLPLRQKSPKRVAHGREMSVINKKHRFLRNTKSQKSTSEGVFEEKSLRTSNILRTG